VEVTSWRECATAPAVIEAAESGAFDLLVLDGEAAPVGGLGLCRQLKNEIFECPPVLVLTGRPQDGWLAAWSQADLAVPHPLDPIALAAAVAELARTVGPSAAAGDRVR
jgi:DNA-binding response OmpR family regulator